MFKIDSLLVFSLEKEFGRRERPEDMINFIEEQLLIDGNANRGYTVTVVPRSNNASRGR
jgi:hypothetical protein